MKYIDAELLRAEIEKVYKSEIQPWLSGVSATSAIYDYVLPLINSLQQEQQERLIPKDLEEAAEKYLDKLFGKSKHQSFYKELFIAGAKWQAEQLLKSSPLPEDTVLFNKGVEEGRRLAEEEQADLFTIVALDAAQRAKEQMLKEAVEGEITKDNRGNNVVRAGVFNNGFEIGNKVRIIVIPNTDEK